MGDDTGVIRVDLPANSDDELLATFANNKGCLPAQEGCDAGIEPAAKNTTVANDMSHGLRHGGASDAYEGQEGQQVLADDLDGVLDFHFHGLFGCSAYSPGHSCTHTVKIVVTVATKHP